MKKNVNVLGVKKLKYEKHLSRPDTYDVMSKSLSKLSGPGQEDVMKMMHRNYTNNLKRHSNANLHGNINLEGDGTTREDNVYDDQINLQSNEPADGPSEESSGELPGSGPQPPGDDDDDSDDGRSDEDEYEEADDGSTPPGPESRDQLGTPPRASAAPPQLRGNVNNDDLGSPPSGSQSAAPPAPTAAPPAPTVPTAPAAPVNISGTFTAFSPDEPHQQNAHEKPQRKGAPQS